MKAYGSPKLKGISACRRSKDSSHRRRCMRVDKRKARREARLAALQEARKRTPDKSMKGD